MNYSIKQLRQKTKEIIDLAENGERIFITYRGKKKAMVVPIAKNIEKNDEENVFIHALGQLLGQHWQRELQGINQR